MPIHRKRFRIEEDLVGEMPMPAAEGDLGPMHREIMAELQMIRSQMARSGHVAPPGAIDPSLPRGAAEANAMLETYRAQMARCEKLKVELDLIPDAIPRPKR